MSKKLLAIVLAFALVFSTFTAAFAEGTISADAQACATLGMLKGDTSAGVTADYVVSTPSRLQSAIMFLRLKGLEDEALAYAGTDNFADANLVPWAGGRAILGYLKSNPELGWVGDQGKFDPNSALKAQDYYKVMLESLGYKQNTATVIGEFTYANIIEFAASKGLTKVATVTNYTVNDLAIATIEALKANVKGSTKTLAASLVEAGIINVQAAVAAGIYAVAPTALAVESVTATNLKEVVVKFNKAVDEDTVEDETLYTIDGITVESAALQADGKTVKLILDDTTLLQNSTEYTLAIDESIVEISVNFTVVDASLPVAQSIELTGPNTFDITFSEPIDSTSAINVDVEDGVYGATPVANDTNIVEVTLGASSLNAGAYDVVVTGAVDFAGHPALKKDFVLNYVKDTTAPVATLVSADQTEVVLDFGKVVTDEDGAQLGASYFYHSYSSYVPDSINWDGSEVTLGFDTYPLPEGTVKIVVDYDANSKVVTDLWGNEMTANTVLTASIEADNAKPVVTKVEVADENVVEVYFSEGLGNGTAAYTDGQAVDPDFFVVKQDGEVIDETFTAVYDADENMVTLDFSADLDGAYTIDIVDIADDAYVANAIADVTVAFNVKDITGINLSAITVEAVDGDTYDTLVVRFTDDMIGTGVYSALNKANYLVSFDGTTFDTLDTADSIAFFNGNDTVKITIADEDAYNVEALASTDDLLLMVSKLADSEGNTSALLGTTITAIPVVAPEITDVVMTSYKTIEVTFDGVIVSAPANGFLISDDNNVATGTAAAVNLAKNSDGFTVATLTLKSAQQLAGGADTTTFTPGNVQVTLVSNLVKADTGEYAVGVTAPVAGAAIPDAATANIKAVAADGIKSVFNTIVADTIDYDTDLAVDDAAIVMNFSEAISNTTYAAFDIIVKDADGEELVAGTDYTAKIIDGDLCIQVTGVTTEAGLVGYTVTSKATVNYLTDAYDNAVTVFTAQEIE